MDNQRRVAPPLDFRRFDGSFKHFCSVKRMEVDRKLVAGGKEIHLHALHEGVMKHKGQGIDESDPNFWLAIATWLRLIRAGDTTPTSLEVADRLAAIYKQYLEEFDNIYVMSFDQEVQQRAMYGIGKR